MLRLPTLLAALLLGTLSCNLAHAEIYKTVDKNGRVTYSDTPPPNTNAKPIELKSINTTPAVGLPNVSYTPPANDGPQDDSTYQLQLIAPANGTTLMADERSVTLSVSLNGKLQNGDLFAYKLDGNTLAKTTEAAYTLNEPPRGEHSLTVEIVDTQDKTLAQSDTITIVVMRPPPKQTPIPVPKK